MPLYVPKILKKAGKHCKQYNKGKGKHYSAYLSVLRTPPPHQPPGAGGELPQTAVVLSIPNPALSAASMEEVTGVGALSLHLFLSSRIRLQRFLFPPKS